jgi:hypothetical protein
VHLHGRDEVAKKEFSLYFDEFCEYLAATIVYPASD